MEQFIAKHQDQIVGVLSGFDRLVMRGTLRSIAYGQGMSQYLWSNQILLKNFGVHVEQVSQRLKAASLAEVIAAGRPVRYLASSTVSKEQIARRIAAEDGITSGPVCVLTCVEPCRSFQIYRNRDTQHLELQARDRKCLFLYHYAVHPVFGFLNARIQTWFPFSIQICLNGREWLAHQMDAVGLGYLRRRQLLSMDRRTGRRRKADGPATQSRVAALLDDVRDVEPDPRRDLRGSSNAVLLVDLSE